MLRKFRKAICSAVSVLVLFSVISGTLTARAAETVTRELPAGILIGDQDGIHVDAHGYYYIDARKLKPGEVIHKIITIENLEYNDPTPEAKIPYVVTMMAEPVMSKGPVDLLNTRCVIKLDGKIVYDGTVRGDGTPNMNITPLELGKYNLGDRHILDVTLTVDPNAQFGEELSEADFKWIFYAYRSLDVAPPKTGVAAFIDSYGYLIPVAALLLCGVILIPLKKKRDEKLRAQAKTSSDGRYWRA
ncbi:MAG: hypothetical protein LBO63_06965 [Oscillospiraceae bacterium]|jgi:hypothetical protein|nr:hypothetical protein [Oscillospiraceae bacterium]